MVEPRFNAKLGVWECPICGFKAMSKGVVAEHITREHKGATERKEGNQRRENRKEDKNKKNNKKKITRHSFKLSKTEIVLFDYGELEIRNQQSWQMFLNRNYVATIHKKKVRVKLITGDEFEGLIRTRDPFFVSLKTADGRRMLIHKGAIAFIELLDYEPT